MAGIVTVNTYEQPPFRMDEILRYAGARGNVQEDLVSIARECADTVDGKLSYRVCWRVFPIRSEEDAVDLGFFRSESESLRRHLCGCEKAVVFAATVGLEMDRLIARYSALSMTKALLLEAVGNERIEALCDLFCDDMARRAAENGERTRQRFSPGYGDLPLEVQRDIFRVLDCPGRLGLNLNESLLMSPTKSVTAIVGVAKDGADGNS